MPQILAMFHGLEYYSGKMKTLKNSQSIISLFLSFHFTFLYSIHGTHVAKLFTPCCYLQILLFITIHKKKGSTTTALDQNNIYISGHLTLPNS
jgi:hypothetical protein